MQSEKQKKNIRSLLENLGIDFQEKDLEELEPKILEDLMGKIVESILTQNLNIYEIYEQILTEVEQMKQELSSVKEQLKTVIPNVDNMQKKDKLLQNELAEASKRFHTVKQESLYLRIQEEKEQLNAKRELEKRLRTRRDELAIKLRRFQSMEVIAKGMVTAIGAVAKFLSNTSSYLKENLTNMKHELDVNEKIIKAHESERFRISRELHDTVAQDLASLLFDASICKKAIEKGMKEDAIFEIDKIRDGIKGGVQGVRQAIFDMRPMAIDDIGLVAAITELAHNMCQRNSWRLRKEIIGKDAEFVRGILPSYKDISVYRIVQESFNNIRHADAKNIDLTIAITEQALTITIKDDGHGFDLEEVFAKKKDGLEHCGLLSMRERAKQINGEFTINSEIGVGTITRLRINI